ACHLAQVVFRRAVVEHVPAGDERHLLHGGDHAERYLPLVVARDPRLDLLPRPAALDATWAEGGAPAAVAGAEAEDGGGVPGRDRRRRAPRELLGERRLPDADDRRPPLHARALATGASAAASSARDPTHRPHPA